MPGRHPLMLTLGQYAHCFLSVSGSMTDETSGSSCRDLDLLSDYDYIAIFDADFKPDSDFLVSSSCPLPADSSASGAWARTQS